MTQPKKILYLALVFTFIFGFSFHYTDASGDVVNDTFSGTAGTSLATHTGSIGATWTVSGGTLKLDGVGGVYQDAAFTGVSGTPSGVTATANWVVQANIHYYSSQSSWLTQFSGGVTGGSSYSIGADMNGGNWYCGGGSANVVTTGCSQAITTVGVHTAQIIKTGSVIVYKLDGLTLGTSTDPTPLTGGGVSMYIQGNQSVNNGSHIEALRAYDSAIPATLLTLGGPTIGVNGQASKNFTVSTNGTLSSNITVTPSDGGAGGTFTPSTLAMGSATTSATFTYTPSVTGTSSISITNTGSLTNPSAVTYNSQTWYVADSFTGTAGTLLTAHTSTHGETWTQTANNNPIKLDGNGGVYADQQYQVGVATISSSSPTGEYTVQGDLHYYNSGPTWQTQIFSDYTSSNGLSYQIGYNLNGNSWIFGGGSTNATLVQSGAVSSSLTTGIYHLKIVRTENTIVYYVNNVALGTTTDPTPLSTGIPAISIQSNQGVSTGAHIENLAAYGTNGVASALSLSGPSAGNTLNTSSNFTVTANGNPTGTVTVTPSDNGGGGTFSPTTVTLNPSTTGGTFTYTPATNGAKTISITNTGGLTNPSSLTYTVTTGPRVVPLPNSNVYAPGWGIQSDRITTQHPGDYLKFAVQNTSAVTLTVDTTALSPTGTSSAFNVKTLIDGVASTTFVVANGTTTIPIATGLSSGRHEILFEIPSMFAGNSQRWTDYTNVLQVKNVTLDAGASILPPGSSDIIRPTYSIWQADSLGEYDGGGDAYTNFPAVVSNNLNWEYENNAFSGTGFVNSYTVNPALYVPGGATNQPINAYDSTHTKLVNGKLVGDTLMIAMGTNDGDTNLVPTATLTARVKADLTYARSIFDGSIYMILPPTSTIQNPYIIAGINNYLASTSDTRVHTVDIGSTNRTTLQTYLLPADSVHMSVAGQAALSTMLQSSITAAFDTPIAPQNVSASTNAGVTTVNYTAPTSDGGTVITGYIITSSPGNISVSTTGLSATVPGLTSGQAYTFTVKAINAVGNGIASAASNTVTPIITSNTPAPAPVVVSSSNYAPSSGIGTYSITPTRPATPTAPNVSVCANGALFNTVTGARCSSSTVTTTTTSTVSPAHPIIPTFTINSNLQKNSVSPEVKLLQIYLNTHGFPIATTGPGSSGHETALFGTATYTALVKFQLAKGILPASGYFGAITRAYVNTH